MPPYGPMAWQESWDSQQNGYLTDREERFGAMIEVVAAVSGGAPRVLDLAGGTGSISLRTLRRFPQASTTLLDIDPVLLRIARDSLDERTAVVEADLRSPGWVDLLPLREYDAVLTATALHWIPADRLATLYGEIRSVLRPGGVFLNADHMPDDGLPALTGRLLAAERARHEARVAAGAVLAWDDWWERVVKDPTLGPLMERRRAVFDGWHAAEWAPPASWHLTRLREAGFVEVGLVWRGTTDATVAAVR
jgi:SAM-dependent methyltransferase